jgi:chromosome segregation ATPase
MGYFSRSNRMEKTMVNASQSSIGGNMSDLVIILNKQVESLERKLAEKFEEVARLKATIHTMDAAIVRLQAEANRNMEELCRARAEKKDEYCQGCALPEALGSIRATARAVVEAKDHDLNIDPEWVIAKAGIALGGKG